jgi:thiamine pyrophosphokinase
MEKRKAYDEECIGKEMLQKFSFGEVILWKTSPVRRPGRVSRIKNWRLTANSESVIVRAKGASWSSQHQSTPPAASMTTNWRPCGLLNGKPANPYAVLVLNQPINRNALDAVIEHATLLVCADAGADRLRQYEQDSSSSYKSRKPDVIVGDLDSLTTETEEYYRAKNVQIVKDPEQYSTDFTKALLWIRDTVQEQDEDGIMDVVVLGGLGGRVDQGFSQIHHLYLASSDPALLKGRMYLLSEQSLSFVLEDGKNVVHVEGGYFEENAGIIPVMGPSTITISGFEWDVTDWLTEFGGQMSTSNHISSDKLEISFNGKKPLFTLELAVRLQMSIPR